MGTSSQQIVETSKVKGADNIMADVTRRLYARLDLGKAVIVVDKPQNSQTLIKRHWAHLTQKLQTKREESHETASIIDLTDEIIKMQSLRFTVLAPFEAPQNNVFIMTPQGLEDILPECATMFVIAQVDDDTLQEAVTCMSEQGIVVRYL